MPCRFAWTTLLAIGALMIGGLGCWSSSSSTRAVGTGGAGWSAAGRSGGLAGAGGASGTGAGGVTGGAGSTGLAGAGSAGLAGAGGVAASGGSGGGAGAGNSAGAGAGGVAGSGGGAGSFGADGGVPVTCDDLHNQYAANLLVARRCTVDAGGQCARLVASSFPQVICGSSGGQTYVNDASALAPDWSEGLALHCSIAIKCGGGGSSSSAIPDGGVCVATDGGSGLCALLLPYATYP